MVRQIPGAAATKEYRCPGCDQEILPGTPHVVAWPAEAPRGGNAAALAPHLLGAAADPPPGPPLSGLPKR